MLDKLVMELDESGGCEFEDVVTGVDVDVARLGGLLLELNVLDDLGY